MVPAVVQQWHDEEVPGAAPARHGGEPDLSGAYSSELEITTD